MFTFVPMYCLSFDIEEFDLPKEHGYDMPFATQMKVSRHGTNAILDILKKHGVKATFFVTVKFAENAPDELSRIVKEGHEVASHGVDHWVFEPAHILESRLRLQELTGCDVRGFRMARMRKIDPDLFAQAGYAYESSLNPTFIPGRYNNLAKPRTMYEQEGGVIQIPASVTPLVRFPMFWLAGHVLPPAVYRTLARRVEHADGYFVTYFHPWEFYDLKSLAPDYKLPAMICHRSGAGMCCMLDSLITDAKQRGIGFGTFSELVRKYNKSV